MGGVVTLERVVLGCIADTLDVVGCTPEVG